MTDQANIHRIIEQAKQQRAEYIGTSIRKHPVVALVVISIPFLLAQVQWGPSAPIAVEIDQNTPRTLMAAPERLTEMLGESSAETFFSSFLNR